MTPIAESQCWDFLELSDDHGGLDRPAAGPQWSAAPSVEVEGKWLVFRYPSRLLKPRRVGLEYRKVQNARSLLTEFVRLDEAPAERILDYARRYGRLGFCQHGDPSHRLLPNGCGVALSATGRPRGVRESLEWWHTLARHARALLNLAAQLSKNKVQDLALAQLNPQLCFSAQHLKEARRHPAAFVAYGVELWLRYFQVRPRISYNEQRKRFEIRISGVPPLPGALAVQIMLTVTRSAGVAVCSSCGGIFGPSRRPNPNRNTYCEVCGRKAAWREAQARRRSKVCAKRKMSRL